MSSIRRRFDSKAALAAQGHSALVQIYKVSLGPLEARRLSGGNAAANFGTRSRASAMRPIAVGGQLRGQAPVVVGLPARNGDNAVGQVRVVDRVAHPRHRGTLARRLGDGR